MVQGCGVVDGWGGAGTNRGSEEGSGGEGRERRGKGRVRGRRQRRGKERVRGMGKRGEGEEE